MAGDEPRQSGAPQDLSAVLDRDLVTALDRFITEMHPGLSRAEGLNLALRDWAGRNGYAGAQVPIRPEDLNASNDD